MKFIKNASVFTLAIALAACGSSEKDKNMNENAATTPQNSQSQPGVPYDTNVSAETLPKPQSSSLVPVYFAFDSAKLSPLAKANLDQTAQILKNQNIGKIMVEGHTDAVGPKDYNYKLGLDRAKRVIGYLENQGVPERMLEPVSYGEELLKIETSEPKPIRENRRVMLTIPKMNTKLSVSQ